MVMADSKKRAREEDSPELDFPEVKRIRDDLLGVLDESFPDAENQDLVSVMKSFEDEISSPTSSSPVIGAGDGGGVVVVDLSSDSGDSQPELGYLLGASDDELGLPPSVNSAEEGGEKSEVAELVRVASADSVEDVGFWEFEEQIPCYNSFELGVVDNYNTEYGTAFGDGLFEYSNVCFDYSDYSWRLETMPAE